MSDLPTVLLDENMPRLLAAVLSGAGVNTTHVADAAAGKNDEYLLAWAAREHWVLVTSDLDFPRLIFAEKREPPLVLIVERRLPCNSTLLVRDILRILKLGSRLHGHVIVFDGADERVRLFPQH